MVFVFSSCEGGREVRRREDGINTFWHSSFFPASPWMITNDCPNGDVCCVFLQVQEPS